MTATVTVEDCMETARIAAQPLLDVAEAAEALLSVIEEPASVQAPFVELLRRALEASMEASR